MKITIGDAISLGSFILAMLTALIGGIYWYGNNEKRKYGLERDFGPIRRNQEQMQSGINLIIREMDHRFDAVDREILEIRSCLRLPTKD